LICSASVNSARIGWDEIPDPYDRMLFEQERAYLITCHDEERRRERTGCSYSASSFSSSSSFKSSTSELSSSYASSATFSTNGGSNSTVTNNMKMSVNTTNMKTTDETNMIETEDDEEHQQLQAIDRARAESVSLDELTKGNKTDANYYYNLFINEYIYIYIYIYI
jgi:hypothetical protein